MKITFETALVHLKQGKKIRRADWANGYHMTIISGIIAVFDPYEAEYRYSQLHTDDLLAEDWEVVE